MKTDEFKKGSSPHTWNDWYKLANCIQSHYVERQERFWKYDDDEEKHDAIMLKVFWDYLETPGMSGDGPYEYFVRPYGDRFDVDFSETSQEEFIQRFGEKGYDYNVVRRLDELARKCDNSIKRSVYDGTPIEWKMLHESTVEANDLINGENSESFLKKYCPIK